MKTFMWQLFVSTVLPVQGSAFSGDHSHMSSPNAWIDLLIDGLPILVFLGLFFFFLKKMTKPQQQMLDQYRIEHITELRRLNTSLERIADALQNRNDDRR